MKILIVDDEQAWQEDIGDYIFCADLGEVERCADLEAAMKIIPRFKPDIVITDGRFFLSRTSALNENAGIDLLKYLRKARPGTSTIYASQNTDYFPEAESLGAKTIDKRAGKVGDIFIALLKEIGKKVQAGMNI